MDVAELDGCTQLDVTGHHIALQNNASFVCEEFGCFGLEFLGEFRQHPVNTAPRFYQQFAQALRLHSLKCPVSSLTMTISSTVRGFRLVQPFRDAIQQLASFPVENGFSAFFPHSTPLLAVDPSRETVTRFPVVVVVSEMPRMTLVTEVVVSMMFW